MTPGDVTGVTASTTRRRRLLRPPPRFPSPPSGLTPPRARASAQRLIEAVREAPFELPGCSLQLTISAGLTLAQAQDTSVQQVMKRADGALYRAKDNGRDRLELALA